MEEINWRLVPFDKFNQRIDFRMFQTDGLKITRNVGHKGEQKKALVTYDRDYVVGFLLERFIKPAMLTDYNEIQKLVSEAWKLFKSGKSILDVTNEKK